MGVLTQLQKASFRGVEFLVTNNSTTGGRKTITHEYPQTDRRVVEDIGKSQKVFSITAIINDPSYLQKRNRLQEALETSGPGILVHPFYGSVAVVAKPYTVTENINALGKAVFSLTFERSDQVIFPEITAQNQSKIISLVNGLIDTVSDFIEDNFIEPVTNFANYVDSQTKVSSFIDGIESASNSVSQAADKIDTLNETIITARADLNSNLASAADLANSITSLFNSIQFIANEPIDQFVVFESLFNFGSDDEDIIENTQTRIDRQTNRTILNNSININSLALAYGSILDITFSDTTELNKYRERLETQYNAIANIEEDNEVEVDILTQLKDLRDEVESFFLQEEKTLSKIIDITTTELPMAVIAYRYYGDLEKEEDLLDLNNTESPAFIKGDIQILTA